MVAEHVPATPSISLSTRINPGYCPESSTTYLSMKDLMISMIPIPDETLTILQLARYLFDIFSQCPEDSIVIPSSEMAAELKAVLSKIEDYLGSNGEVVYLDKLSEETEIDSREFLSVVLTMMGYRMAEDGVYSRN